MPEVVVQRGCLMAIDVEDLLLSNGVLESLVAEKFRLNREARDGQHHHITIISREEMKTLSQEQRSSVPVIATAGLRSLGLGRVEKGGDIAYFISIVWEEAAILRASLHLGPKDFHITVGFSERDVHNISKDAFTLIRGDQGFDFSQISSLLQDAPKAPKQRVEVCTAVSHHLLNLEQQLEQRQAELLFRAYVERARAYGILKDYAKSVQDISMALEYQPATPRALLILGDGLRMLGNDKEAIVNYKAGVKLCLAKQAKIRTNLLDRLAKLSVNTSSSLAKFPRTCHIYNLGAATRDDLLLPKDKREQFCSGTVFVEEKVDGANLGIYYDKDWNLVTKNRSHFVCSESAVQWSGLDKWLDAHRIELSGLLGQRFTLYGEWMYAKHSIHYDALPGLFLAFDLYDRVAERFLSVASRDRLLKRVSIPSVKTLRRKPFKLESLENDLLEMLEQTQSNFRMEGNIEGLVLRSDEEDVGPDVLTFQLARAKLVRADFIQGIDEHWTKQSLVRNIVRTDGSNVNSAPENTKYPSTPHLPFSPCVHSDDIVLNQMDTWFTKQRVIVTEKLDGGNCCLKEGLVFGRTHSREASHWSFGPVKQLYATMQMTCSELFEEEYVGLELFGENMTAMHSIMYDALCSPFYLFGARCRNTWLSWDEVCHIAARLNVPTVPVVFDGTFENVDQLQKLLQAEAAKPSRCSTELPGEGFVVRLPGSFENEDFDRSIIKYVRENHVQTGADWKSTCQKATISLTFEEAKLSIRPPVSDNRFQLYVDLDGVLADFDEGVLRITNKNPGELAASAMWRSIEQARNFFGDLKWMPGAEKMWNDELLPLNPTILSGVPMSSTRWAHKQKLSWCTRLGDNVPVILCSTREKSTYSGKNRILIDDRARSMRPWQEAGGIFILHKNVEDTVKQLKEIMSKSDDEIQEDHIKEKKSKKKEKPVKRRKPKFKLLVLVGFPGSGKSCLAKKLASSYTRVCQDELGSRGACEELVGKSIKKGSVVVDRCNVQSSERKRWIDLAMVNQKQAAVVHFDVSADECISRVLERPDHPTIKTTSAQGAGRIINSFAKRFQEPTTQEGFQTVFTVRTFQDVEDLVNKL